MKPILFNTDMVKAILDGRKTMTRRVCKLDTANFDYDLKDKDYGPFLQNEYGDSINVKELAPYQPGDILYVRETWAEVNGIYIYKADEDATPLKWRPSIHMPKEAARIWLEVTDVRVERLQKITYDDCLSEGMWDYGTDVDTLIAYQELWQSLNAKKGYGWYENPWVWVYEFKRLEVYR